MHPNIPQEYAKQVADMAEQLRNWAAASSPRPLFRLPPPEALMITPLGPVLDRVAINDSARGYLESMIARYPCATLFMLCCALTEYAGVRHVALAEFLNVESATEEQKPS